MSTIIWVLTFTFYAGRWSEQAVIEIRFTTEQECEIAKLGSTLTKSGSNAVKEKLKAECLPAKVPGKPANTETKKVVEKLKVINLLAGPGSGKSTTRAELFGKMKRLGIRVEETTEYAKDVTYDKNFDKLTDQLYILANQNRRLWRLRGQVEWVVNDSPLLLSYHYATPEYLPKTFRELVFELWDQYDNYNFYIERFKPYQQYGRTQTEEEAKVIDDKIKNMLKKHGLDYTSVVGSELASTEIIRHIMKAGELNNVNPKLL